MADGTLSEQWSHKKHVECDEFLKCLVGKFWKTLEAYINRKEVKDEVLKATKQLVSLEEVRLNEPVVLHEAKVLDQNRFKVPDTDSLLFELG